MSRFDDLIDRRLAFFVEDNADLIEACEAAERAYDRAGREEAEERYSEYLDLIEEGGETHSQRRATLRPDARPGRGRGA